MVYYDTCAIYIQSAKSDKEKYKKITAIIDMLYATALTAAENDNITEYTLDDGQTKIRTVYRNTAEILKSIEVLEMQQERLLNKLNGRITRHVDSKNLNRFSNGFR